MATGRITPRAADAVIQQWFAPMHKRAFGMAVALTAAVVMFAVTAFHVLLAPGQSSAISLLSQYFYGYQVDWQGAFIGAGWAGVAGFAAGFFFAFVRNFALALWLFTKRTKADLMATRDILDQL